jgi:ubiquinone/menaquinone biosynthesis C-methylase UbiE
MKYDRIGIGYDTTRRVDPSIAARLVALLDADTGFRCLDVACGTGNYTNALSQLGLDMVGIDQSPTMLATARDKFPAISWRQADVTALPFADAVFAGAVCTLAIHHFGDIDAAVAEMLRVVGGRIVIFTSTPEQMRQYWLNAYFPGIMERSIERMPSLARLAAAISRCDGEIVSIEPWFIPTEPIDLFLYSGKYKPEIYLDGRVRRGISSFAELGDAQEIADGLARLSGDIGSGAIASVMARFASDLGDYTFVTARKLS